LLKLWPTGASGFEGLVAMALARVTNLTFRLAKSGLQFGRDATTPRGRFAIAMEAKRYDDALRLEDLAGKIWIAANELTGDVDLWTLCATAEVGEGVLSRLEAMLEERGLNLLVLDWTNAALPRLAILLAAAAEDVIAWCATSVPPLQAEAVARALTTVRSQPSFDESLAQLRRDLNGAAVGLSSFCAANEDWAERALSDRAVSRVAFGQYLTVADPTGVTVERPALTAELMAAIAQNSDRSSCITVLGPEGSGKSWLVANAWATSADRPILIIGAAKAADYLDSSDPLKTLARLIAAQGEGDAESETAKWARRLRRWRDAHRPDNGLRFLIVLDGLNEVGGKPWAELIVNLSAEALKLGGRLVVTCREGYWAREVQPRLAGVDLQTVRVGDYTDTELDTLLRDKGVVRDRIPAGIIRFVRNPRICSVAIDLIDRLRAQADELTVERLLLEYWRKRLEERGDLVAHNVRDFENLLRSHARAFRENPNVQFDRDDWRQHSGAARRSDGRSVENDLSDIEEGAFLRGVADREGFYEFKPETVPFALGLLITREIENEVRIQPTHSPSEVIDTILEEVRGFDLVAEAVRSAVGIACFEEGYPQSARVALVAAWLDMQNVEDGAYEHLPIYATASPDAVIAAAEAAWGGSRINTRAREWLLSALFERREHPAVLKNLKSRLPNWLSRWSRQPQPFGSRDDHEIERQRRAVDAVERNLNALTPSEREFLSRACVEVADHNETDVDELAALLIMGLPQADLAEAVVAWAFAIALTEPHGRADETLCWAVRRNRIDYPKFAEQVHSRVDRMLTSGVSDVGREAAATVLRVLGSEEAAQGAEQLSPRPVFEGRRRVEDYCATDPYDPASTRPDNLERAIEEAAAIDPGGIWNHMSPGKRDHELDWIRPGLARFDPPTIVPLLRAIAGTAESRVQLPLRQLSWHLSRLSPLFDESTRDKVAAGYSALAGDLARVDVGDQRHVPASMLLSLLPHFSATEQLSLYQTMPVDADWCALRGVMGQLTRAELENALVDAETDANRLRRVLFFASAASFDVSEAAREVIGRALEHENPNVSSYAFEFARRAGDAALDRLVIAAARRGRRDDAEEPNRMSFLSKRAIASAVIRTESEADLDLIGPELLGAAASALGERTYEHIRARHAHMIDRLLSRIATEQPKLGRLTVEVDRTGREVSQRVDDRAEEQKLSPSAHLRRLFDEMNESNETFEARQAALHEEADDYLKNLSEEDARFLAREPDIEIMTVLASRDEAMVEGWAERICAETDRQRLGQVRNYGFALTIALAPHNSELAAQLYRHLSDHDSPVNIVYGDARLPLQYHALFVKGQTSSFTEMRAGALRSATSDAELETLVFAAERGGYGEWLSDWTDLQLASSTPDDVARALAVAGLRGDAGTEAALPGGQYAPGFLGAAAERAQINLDRDRWARTWMERAFETDDPVQFWRYSELSLGILDIRAFQWFPSPQNELSRRFGDELFSEVRRAVERRSSKRKSTLLGMRRPSGALLEIIRATA
jgi:hypothetical protein